MLFGCATIPEIPPGAVYGRITDAQGDPIEGAAVVISTGAGAILESAVTQDDGSYVLPAVPEGARNIWAGKTAPDDLFTYVPQEARAEPGRRDFTLQPGANILLTARDETGAAMTNAQFRQRTASRVFLTDMSGHRAPGWFGGVSSAAIQWSWDKATPALIVEPGHRYRILAQWEVPGAGKLLFTLDNDGQGYALDQAGAAIHLNLDQEIAHSSVAALRAGGADAAGPEHLLHKADAEAAADWTAARADYARATAQSLTQREQQLLARTGAEIGRYRKGDAAIVVRDRAGNPLPGVMVELRQTSSDFLFGANPMSDDAAYQPQTAAKMHLAGFNQSYVTARWGLIESSPGEYDWKNIDEFQLAQQHRQDGFTTAGALSLWFTANPDFVPSYLRHSDLNGLETAVGNYARALAGHYAGAVGIWHINEINLDTSNVLSLDWSDRIAVTRAFATGIREGNPSARIMNSSLALAYDVPDSRSLPELYAAGSPVDIVGLELYQAGVTTNGDAPIGLDLTAISRLLDEYSELGKPVIVDEFSAPSEQQPGSSWWRRPWSPAQQAEYATAVYRLAFSKPSLQGITWAWGICDRNSWIRNGGLFDDAMQPKPAFAALKSLLASWRSNGHVTTGADGTAIWRGFAGDYDVEVRRDGKLLLHTTLHVTEQKQQQIELQIAETAKTAQLSRRSKTAPHSG